MSLSEGTTENPFIKNDETAKKLKSENKILKLQEDEYQLEMSLYDNNLIEFKVSLNSPMATCCFIENYNFETIKKISFLFHNKYKDSEGVYQYYKKKIFAGKEINLELSPDKNIMSLKYQKIVDEETIDVELKLKKKISNKDDIVQALMTEVEQLKKKDKYYEKKIDELKKNIDLLMEENKKFKEKEKENEKRKNEDEKNEENWKIEEEKLSSFNDNVNLINNFKFENYPELKYMETISCGSSFNQKTVAVYCIIKNNERLYQMAYYKNKYYSNNYQPAHIIIYNLVSNKIENKIYNAHKHNIKILKHYYNSSAKTHILLSSSYYSSSDYYNFDIKLWNISSNPIINILNIKDKYVNFSDFCFCLMFKNEDIFIFGNDKTEYEQGVYVWNKSGARIKKINKINLNRIYIIETTYFENKNYILLSGYNYDEKKRSGNYFSECYNYDEDDIKTYKDDEKNSNIYCMNLFKKGNEIYLITGSNQKVNIFEFYTTKFIKRIQIGESSVNSLCSINEKYIIASNSSKLKIIDMEKYSVVKDYSVYEDGVDKFNVNGIEKIKIPEKGEFIITYSYNGIFKIWKM